MNARTTHLRAPVTLIASCAAVLATILLHDAPGAWSYATTWMIHAGPRHLLLDLVPFAVVGLWIEPRVGSKRFSIWLGATVAACALLHLAFYPHQRWMFGLSAIVYALACAGVIRLAIDTWWGRALLAFIVVRLTIEALPGASTLTELAGGFSTLGDASTPVTLGAVPLVHAGAALVGVVLGGAARYEMRVQSVEQGTSPACSAA